MKKLLNQTNNVEITVDPMKKIINNVLTAALAVLVIYFLLIAYGTVNNPWYKVIAIDGGSMSPTIDFGDMVVITHATNSIPAGTVVTMSVDGALVTHRLVADYNQGGKPQTKGDANEIADAFPSNSLGIVGIVRYRIPYMAYPFFYLRFLLSKI